VGVIYCKRKQWRSKNQHTETGTLSFSYDLVVQKKQRYTTEVSYFTKHQMEELRDRCQKQDAEKP
jgi:hypothetical protein